MSQEKNIPDIVMSGTKAMFLHPTSPSFTTIKGSFPPPAVW